jgi:hypothetical protein
MVMRAWPDVAGLEAARDALLAAEKADVLFDGVKVCPFAGYIDGGAGRSGAVDERRVGCLLHPSRHPAGEDLRDLAVYPKEVCAGHFCAPHDWLRPVEVACAQCAVGVVYGRVVTDAGLVKAVCRAFGDLLGRALRADDVAVARADIGALWDFFLLSWPWRDPDPRRFGGFAFGGDDAVERTLPSAMAGLTVQATQPERLILDALGTRSLNDNEAARALNDLRGALGAAVAVLGTVNAV